MSMSLGMNCIIFGIASVKSAGAMLLYPTPGLRKLTLLFGNRTPIVKLKKLDIHFGVRDRRQ